MRSGNDKIIAMVPSRAPAFRIALAVLFLGCPGCRIREEAPPAPEPTKALAAGPAATPDQPPSSEGTPEPWIGVLVARQSVDVTSETQGRLAAIHVRIGDLVRRGQSIATLDTRIASQELEMARSALRGADADAARAGAEAAEARQRNDRRRSNPDFFSKEDLAEAELRMKTSTSESEAAQARVGEQCARVRQLEAALGQSEVRASFAGRVAERFVDPGAMVGPGVAIVRLISSGDFGDLIVRAAVPPEEAGSLAVGSAVTVHVRTLGLDLRGRIERIAPEVDAASQMILIEARLEIPAGAASPHLQTGLVVDVQAGIPPPL